MARFRDLIPKPDPEKEQQKIDQLSQEEVSWKDKLAMILSAYLVIALPVILVLLALVLGCMWIFGML